MEARITITTTDGSVYEGAVTLSPAGGSVKAPRAASKKSPSEQAVRSPDGLEFSLPVRPFIKKYSAGMSGSRRLVLLVARLASGVEGSSVSISEVQDAWGKMTALMGGAYNSAHASRARDNGWVDSPKAGTLTLLNGWKGIL